MCVENLFPHLLMRIWSTNYENVNVETSSAIVTGTMIRIDNQSIYPGNGNME